MVAARVDLRAVELLVARNGEAVFVFGELSSHGFEVLCDQGDAVGLLDAELFGIPDGDAFARVGSDCCKNGQLVDELGR